MCSDLAPIFVRPMKMNKARPPVKFHDGVSSLLPDEHLRLIGAIIHNGSSMEHTCRFAIELMLKSDKDMSTIVTSRMNARTLFDTFKHLALYSFSENRKGIEKISKRLERARIIRNLVAHARWHGDQNAIYGNGVVTARTDKVTYQKRNGFRMYSEKHFTDHQLRRLSLFMHGTNWRLLTLLKDYGLINIKDYQAD